MTPSRKAHDLRRCTIENQEVALYWLIFGVVLILAELVVPGLVLVFLGMAAIIVALLIYVGWLGGWAAILVAWFVISMLLILSLRQLFSRLVPGDTEKGNMDEDVDAFGAIVKVVDTFEPDHVRARILFRGTTWDAESLDGPLKAGKPARLLNRQNLVWVVEPYEPEFDDEE